MITDEFTIAPLPGPQTQFLASDADICWFGGGAGGGKTRAIIMDGGRWSDLDIFNGVIFRRKSTDARKPGSLLSATSQVYAKLGGKVRSDELLWRFPQGAQIKLAGLQYESDVNEWQGAELDWIAFEELTHYEESQFWYMLSRLRSASGKIKPYCRATLNPPTPNTRDPQALSGKWIRNMLKWFLNKDGTPDRTKSGILRWFIRLDEEIHWFESKREAELYIENNHLKMKPMSFTFIPATAADNPVLLEKNPEYVSWLHSLPPHEKDALLYGNFNIRPIGKLFKAADFNSFTETLKQYELKIITVDTAQQVKTANDYTVYQSWTKWKDNIYLEKQRRGKWEFNEQLQFLKAFILAEKPHHIIIEAMANGTALIQMLRRELPQYRTKIIPITRDKDKYKRGQDCQGVIQDGRVFLNPHDPYYDELMDEVIQFSPENRLKNVHDDQVDCMMDAIDKLLLNPIYSRPDEALVQKIRQKSYSRLV